MTVKKIEGIRPLPTTDVNAAIQENLVEFIRSQGLSAGDRLPSEALLAQSLRVGRSALREALRSLQALGIIEARVGSGWYVRKFSMEPLTKGLVYSLELTKERFADLVELRVFLECSFLAEAAQTLTAEDLDALEEKVAKMEEATSKGNRQEAYEQDHLFHQTLFAKVKNQLFHDIIEMCWRLVYVYYILARTEEQRPPEVVMAEAHKHQYIVAALRADDVALARHRLEDSLQGALRALGILHGDGA